MDSLPVLNFVFPCRLRGGFHVFKELWNPRLNEKFDTIHEETHAGWLFALYDYLTGAEGRKCILKGWEKA